MAGLVRVSLGRSWFSFPVAIALIQALLFHSTHAFLPAGIAPSHLGPAAASSRLSNRPRAAGLRGMRLRGTPSLGMTIPAEVTKDKTVGTAPHGMYKEFHHIHMWVGNAKQTATYFIARMGFEPVAYRGLETGNRDSVTHVVQQGKIQFAFSSALNPGNDEMGEHHKKHGDGVKDVAILVADCQAVYDMVMAAGGKSVREPHIEEDEHGKCIMATVETYGDTVHTFVQNDGYSGCFLPGFRAVTEEDPLARIFSSPKLEFIDHVVGNQVRAPPGAAHEPARLGGRARGARAAPETRG
jgi:hypothetical protein